MKKRLIICGDGTWNEPGQSDHLISSPTNVVKLAAAISSFDTESVPQIVCYHTGVGTGHGIFDHLGGGALGVGISVFIQDLYLFLVLNYTPGDELFFFGFSRGAYAVRSLAGLIRNCGILKKENVEKFQEAYALYRDRTDKTHPNSTLAINFREQYSWPDFQIRFIGVWETVGALGIPIPLQIGRKLWEFHDVELSSHVDYAYQALAIDERRKPFVPCVWVKQGNSQETQILEQAWFPGVHCNVGGGYRDSALSDCALEWMSQKAKSCGLALEERLQTSIAPNTCGILRNSMTFWYRLLGINIRIIGAKLPISNEQLSLAALERKARLPGYNPRNLVEFMERL